MAPEARRVASTPGTLGGRCAAVRARVCASARGDWTAVRSSAPRRAADRRAALLQLELEVVGIAIVLVVELVVLVRFRVFVGLIAGLELLDELVALGLVQRRLLGDLHPLG